MRLHAGLLLNLLIAAIAGNEVKARTLRSELEPLPLLPSPIRDNQLIVATPNNYKILSHIDDLEQRDHEVLWRGPLRTYHMLNVTDEEKIQLDNTARFISGPVTGLAANNDEIYAQQTSGTISAVNSFLDKAQRCKTTISNTTAKYLVFIMDGYINTNNTVLSGMPVIQQFNIAGATPGILTHGSKVAQTILGDNQNFIQRSGIQAVGLTVFGDDGRGRLWHLSAAADKIQSLLKQYAQQQFIVGATFSGNSARVEIIDMEFAELSLLLPVSVSAGNNHADCSTVSPPLAGANVIPVGGTSNQNGTPVPNYSSNWNCGLNMVWTPFCGTTASFNRPGNSEFCGTSRSAPEYHKVLAYYSVACPTCTIEQRISLTRRATVSIDSSVGPISVFPTDKVCPLDNTELFSNYKTANKKLSPSYNSTTEDGKFCTAFKVSPYRRKSGASLLFFADKTRLSVSKNNIHVKNQMTKNGFANFAITSQNDESGVNKNRITLWLQTGAKMKPILTAFSNKAVQNITFGSYNWDATVSHARKCLLG